MTPLEKTIRNSDLSVAKEKRTFLTYTAAGLAPCTLEETEDSVKFIFNTTGTQAETILGNPKHEQLRFLVNCANLHSLETEYNFDLSLTNIQIDINLMPQILIRDTASHENIPFLERYKALVASVLQRKYKYENYISGGQDLYKKNKLLTELTELETVSAIQSRLLEEYTYIMKETTLTQKLVPIKNVLFCRIAIPILTIALLAALVYGGWMLLIEMPFQNAVINASNAYIHSDHLSVQRELRNYSIDRLSDETKYFLSCSYVSTEALTHAQISNILLGLARLTEPIIFDYWILLGRLYFDEAVDIAQRLGDDELLLFAYIKQEIYVRNDMSIPGDERTALLSYLVGQIERLEREREEAEEDAQ